jgi:hypothetical protein
MGISDILSWAWVVFVFLVALDGLRKPAKRK